MTGNAIYTIGHSTRSLEELLALLRENGVDTLVDVRAFPGSRRYPHFNKENLQEALPAAGIAYVHMRSLGGRRKSSEVPPESPNTLWRNESFRRYADYALGGEYQEALEELEKRAETRVCALMCSEAVWWRCHRRIITDWLLARGHRVLHIMGEDKTDPASLTPGAEVRDGAKVVYPPASKQDSLF